MEMLPLTSSNLAAYGYDQQQQLLRIEFRNGGAYTYSGVPQHVATGLAVAQSPGRYFATSIKNSYTWEKE